MQFKMNAKGQAGETLTWIVATLIIILMLIAFLFVVDLISKTRMPDFKSSKGNNYDLAVQEMLFSVLSYKNLESLIDGKMYSEAGAVATEALGKFQSLGVKCSFYAYDETGIKISIINGAGGNSAEINNGMIKMRCENG